MEKNFAIYNEMRAAAERVFNEGVNAPAGLYSLAELAKVGTTCKTAPTGVYFREEYNTSELININVDGFECSYPACKAFALAYKFERLAKVGAKERAVFQRSEDHGEAVAIFTVDAVLCDSLAACEDPRKRYYPQLQGVYIDLATGLACCCDSFALNVSRLVDAQVFNADALTFGGVILSRAFIKGAKGCEVSIYKDGATLCAVASNGASCHEIPERYPNYKSVFPRVDESAPVRFVKSIRGLKKTAAAVAKAAGCEYVCLSGYNGDNFITVSAQGDGGEITRRVALAERLAATFAVACSAVRLKTINNAADTLYIAQDESMVFSGSKCVAMIAPCNKKEIMTATATAADNEATQLECNYNAFAAFAAPVAPADSIQAAEGIDNADTFNIAPVAPADSIQEAESIDNADTLDIAPVAPADSIQAAEGIDNADTLNIAPVAPADSIQEAEGIDNADTLNIAPVAPADNIQAAESIDNADTPNIEPVAPADSIQAAESIDNADTLNIEPVAPADSIQAAESTDNADTLNIAPVAPADSIQEVESIDNARTVNLRRLMLVCLRVAAVILFALFVRIVSTDNSTADTLHVAPVPTADSIQAAESIDNADTLNIATVAPADSIQAAESIDNADTLNIAPVTPADSIQTAEGIDNADTLNIAPVTPADSIQAVDTADTADTLHVAPVVPADSIQAVDTADTADTLHVAPVVPADSIQAVDTADTADTLHVAPVVPADSIQAVDTADTADTLHVAPVVPADSIQAVDTADTADTLHVAPVVPADSIQAVDTADTADTLHVAPVVPADSIQAAESTDNADTLDVAPVAPVHPIL